MSHLSPEQRARDLANAMKVWSSLGLDNRFRPVARFGASSGYGKVFKTLGNKLLKISNWSKNSEREMRVAKIAGRANVGPKVWNTRKYSANGKHLAVMTMNEVPNAKNLYNAINNGTIPSFKNIQNAIGRMHSAGIHHGNLHGGNILVYVGTNGRIRIIPIDFGAAKHHRGIKNSRSAVKYAIERRGWRGGSVAISTHNGVPVYRRPGRNQPIVSNENMLAHLRTYFNKHSPYRNAA